MNPSKVFVTRPQPRSGGQNNGSATWRARRCPHGALPGGVERLVHRTKRGANRVAEKLTKGGSPADAIHGNNSQNARTRTLEAFKRGRTRVLVATDLAARGIDVDGITHVINYELPEVPETYVHRIGRTARAGATGIAISLCASDEREQLRGIERLIRCSVPVAGGRAPEHSARRR